MDIGEQRCLCLRFIPFLLPQSQQHLAGSIKEDPGKSLPARALELMGSPPTHLAPSSNGPDS